ncbi:MAG: Coenzyme F420 hydrogenase/dehydrogenase, beta subunit C-terminal domain [Paludibacteraceae bacterium]|nr:Coenzyme F420 hydrogenase/dehydrogenase, beta subunit C-terminal domain [Paludibacteraceae bacterium]
MKNTVSDVVANDECCGCGACVNICPTGAIEYTEDKYGFITPTINQGICVLCGQCLEVCTSRHFKQQKPLEAYAAMARDTKDRLAGSSGGIFGVLTKKILEEGGVVYGAKMDEEFQVYHVAVTEFDSRDCILGSKYVQSHMGEVYKDIVCKLKAGKKVLFSGTPCQVAAVKRFIPSQYQKQLLLVDVVCHGVPSQKFFDSYIANLSRQEGIVEKYRFRAKEDVNNGMNWFFSYKVKGEKNKVRNWPEDTFNFLYMKSYIYRKSCYNCKFASVNRCSDITLCDYWGWNRYHSCFDVGSTVSGVLINTEKGEGLFESIDDQIEKDKTNIENIKRHNGCLSKPSEYNPIRETILEMWQTKGFSYIEKQFLKHNKWKRLKSRIYRNVPINVRNKLVQMKTRRVEGQENEKNNPND